MNKTFNKMALLAALLTTLSLSAYGQPKFTCPVEWGELSRLDGSGGLDVQIYGLRVRDWKAEHLEAAMRRYDECQRLSSSPQSLKDAERRDAVKQAALVKSYLGLRDARVLQEAAGQRTQAQAKQAGSARIGLDSNGRLMLDAGVSSDPLGCAEAATLSKDWLSVPSTLQGDLPKFYAACTQAGQLTPAVALRFKTRVAELQQDLIAQKQFVATVQALAKSPQQQTHASLLAVEEQWHFGQTSDPSVLAAGRQVDALRTAVDARECAAHAKAAGFTSELLGSQYLLEANLPVPFLGMPCTAARGGISFKYQSAGLFGKEGFEIKGRSSVAVKLARQKMPDGTVLLVPTSSTVNGQSQAVTRGNIQLLAHQIKSALNNE